jgi:membrane-associated phospholipid phosphatase
LLRFTCVPLAAFAVLAYHARDGATLGWDRDAVAYFDRRYYELTGLRRVAEALVYLGLAVGVVIAVLLLFLLTVRGLRRQALFWGLAIAAPILLTPLLKWIFGRPQIGANPEGDYSFPSGNAMVSAAFTGALLLLFPRLRGVALVPAVALGFAYGAALVVLLWHYPSDVVAGWCVALTWVAGSWVALGTPVVPDLALGAGSPPSAERR